MESRSSFLRPLAVALVLSTGFTPLVVRPAAAAAPAPTGWTRPVPGRVIEAFKNPKSRYGAGHRGVDFAAAPGTQVRAPRDGVVVYAGSVAGTLHVVIDHGQGIRTSVSFLATISVREGARIARGAVVGTAGAVGPAHEIGVLHFGVRVRETYIDPMALFRTVDLAEVIRLVPVEHQPDPAGLPTRSGETRSLAATLHLPMGIPGISPDPAPNLWDQATGYLWDQTPAPIKIGLGNLAWSASTAWDGSGQFLELVIAHSPVRPVIEDLRSVAGRFWAYYKTRDGCTEKAAAVAGPGGGGSGHRLMAVGGINSSTNRTTGVSVALDTKALGYDTADVNYYSYAADGGPYQATDTYGNLVTKAEQLRDQLRELQREEPGREVDLVAHSQGGVVIDAFLQLVYDPADPTLPPLGTVATLSSPHLGAPAATVGTKLRAGDTGRRLLELTESLTGAIPPSNGVSTRQLAEESRLMKRLWAKPLPDQIELTSIAAQQDVVVPGPSTEAPGARLITVDPDGLMDHSEVVSDPAAMRTVRLILEQRPPECVGWAQGLRGAIQPVAIRRFELTLGEVASRLLDPLALP